MDRFTAPEALQRFFAERAQLQAFRRNLREQNIKAKENYASLKLDQRMLKLQQVMKFLSKLKACKQMDRDSILNEIDNFNLQKYIFQSKMLDSFIEKRYMNEITLSISEQPITDTDVLFFVQVCSKLHQSYEEFQIQMVFNVQKQIKTGIIQKEKDEKVIIQRRRDMMRFLAELFVVGFTIQPDKVLDCLKEIILQKESRALLQNVSTALMFSERFGFEILRCKGRKLGLLYEQYENLGNVFDFDQVMPAEKCQKMLATFQKYIEMLVEHLKSLHNIKLEQDEKINQLIAEESATEKDEEIYKKARNNYFTLLEAISTLADNLELTFELGFGEEEQEKRQQQIIDEQRKKKQEEQERIRLESENVFDSEEERAFYEQILDLKLKLPAQLFQNNYFQVASQKTQAATTDGNAVEDEGEPIEEPEKEQEDEVEEEEEKQVEEEENQDEVLQSYDQFRKNLRHCVSEEKADKLAEQFLYVNNKANRKRLVRDLVEYRKEYNLMVPHLCRMVAVITKHFKDLGDMVVEKLIKDFDACKDKQRQDFSFRDKKTRYLKYLCELAKFRVLDLQRVLGIFKSLVDDFNTQQVDLLCVIMDSIGRFIYNNPDTRSRYLSILETLNAYLRKANLPTNKSIQLENSITLTKPSKKKAIKPEKKRTEMEQYIRFLILERLTIVTFKDITGAMKDLPWDEELDEFCFSAIMKRALKGRIDDIQLCAGLLAFLNTFRSSLTIKIVDELIERTISGMEENEVQQQQRRISVIRFLGELYLYSVVEIDFIFDLLYLILQFGHEAETNKEEEERMDGPDDLFRISMVCNFLEPVRQYVTKKRQFPKVLRFLIFFQRYILSKKYVPIDIEFMVLDTFESLDSGSNRITQIKTFDLANELVQIIESKEKNGTLKTIEEELSVFLKNNQQIVDNKKKVQDGKSGKVQALSPEEEELQNQQNKQFDDEIDRELQSIIHEDNQIMSQMINQKNVNFNKKKIVSTTTKVNLQNDSGQTKTVTIIKKKKDNQPKETTNLNNFLYGQDGILNDGIQFKLPKSKKK